MLHCAGFLHFIEEINNSAHLVKGQFGCDITKNQKKFRSFLQLKHVKYLLNSISNTSEPKLHNFIYVIIFLHK